MSSQCCLIWKKNLSHTLTYPQIVCVFHSYSSYIPQKSIHCSLHTTSSNSNVKHMNERFNISSNNSNNNLPLRYKQHQQQHQHQQRTILDSSNRFDAFNHVPLTRNASTSTLDLDNELDDGDPMSMQQSNHRMMRDKSGGNNKLDFNNICGMMRSNKTKDCNANLNMYHRMKPAKNIYYIKDQHDDEEPNIFIVDPRFYKNRKCALQKSLEDIRMQKTNNNSSSNNNINNAYARHYHHDTASGAACNGWNNFSDRSKTLPRDFARQKHNARPSLGNFLDNFHQDTSEARWAA